MIDMLKTPGIPLWVTIFALLLLGTGVGVGIMTFANPDMGPSMAGRTLGLGLAAGLAVFLKSPAAYLLAFIAGIPREIGDILAELSKAEPSYQVIGFIALFLILGLAGAYYANKARD